MHFYPIPVCNHCEQYIRVGSPIVQAKGGVSPKGDHILLEFCSAQCCYEYGLGKAKKYDRLIDRLRKAAVRWEKKASRVGHIPAGDDYLSKGWYSCAQALKTILDLENKDE